jgi:cytochrome c oxidase subunit II
MKELAAAFPASALHPAGPEAQALADLMWVLFAGAAAILAVVVVLAAYAVYRRPDRRLRVGGTAIIVAGGLVLPVIMLSALLVYGVGLTRERRADASDALRIDITAYMWWWEVRYAGEEVVTANEIYIPAGRPIVISLTSADVIHAFWVPSLAGKVDVFPGRTTRLPLRAERPGRYHGQCAEFCGAQHALMALDFVAQEPAAFERWLENQRQAARAPGTPVAAAGRGAFLAHGCGNCHGVRGVSDPRVNAPDLTHVASRAWLGGGALRNSRANLLAWIAQGEAVKPERAMPSYGHLPRETLDALAEYLAGLE